MQRLEDSCSHQIKAVMSVQVHDGDSTLPVQEAQLARSAWQTAADVLAARPDLLDAFLQDERAHLETLLYFVSLQQLEVFLISGQHMQWA